MVPNKKDILNNVLDLLLSVKWTHKITAIHYDRLSKYDTTVKWVKVIATILSSSSVASLFAWNTLVGKIFAMLGTLLFTTIEIVTNKFSLGQNRVLLFNAKEDLWNISVELTALARCVKSSHDNDDLSLFHKKYLELLNEVKKVQRTLPSASERDTNNSSDAINCKHDDNNWENEGNMLPPDLRDSTKE